MFSQNKSAVQCMNQFRFTGMNQFKRTVMNQNDLNLEFNSLNKSSSPLCELIQLVHWKESFFNESYLEFSLTAVLKLKAHWRGRLWLNNYWDLSIFLTQSSCMTSEDFVFLLFKAEDTMNCCSTEKNSSKYVFTRKK